MYASETLRSLKSQSSEVDHQKLLDKLLLDVVPKKAVEPKIKLDAKPLDKPHYSVEELRDKELMTEAQIARVLTAAIVKSSNAPKKIQSHVTQEMIDEYQDEQRKPLEINGKKYVLHTPSSTLELEEYEELHKDVPSQDQLDSLSEQFLHDLLDK